MTINQDLIQAIAVVRILDRRPSARVQTDEDPFGDAVLAAVTPEECEDCAEIRAEDPETDELCEDCTIAQDAWLFFPAVFNIDHVGAVVEAWEVAPSEEQISAWASWWFSMDSADFPWQVRLFATSPTGLHEREVDLCDRFYRDTQRRVTETRVRKADREPQP